MAVLLICLLRSVIKKSAYPSLSELDALSQQHLGELVILQRLYFFLTIDRAYTQRATGYNGSLYRGIGST
ncbi:MAG: hypothetical protein ACI95X_001044, partial [Paraglaciecola sp.]